MSSLICKVGCEGLIVVVLVFVLEVERPRTTTRTRTITGRFGDKTMKMVGDSSGALRLVAQAPSCGWIALA